MLATRAARHQRAARVLQPRRRPGRARLRRPLGGLRLVRRRSSPARRSSRRTWSSPTSTSRRAGATPQRAHVPRRCNGTAPEPRRGRARRRPSPVGDSTAPWSQPLSGTGRGLGRAAAGRPATTSPRTASRQWWSACRAASTRPSPPPSRSMRSGPRACSAWRCPRATPAPRASPTRRPSPSCQGIRLIDIAVDDVVAVIRGRPRRGVRRSTPPTSPRRTCRPAPAARC